MNNRYKMIVCPVDFSECSELALEQAAALSGASGAELLLLAVLQPLPLAAFGEPMTPSEANILLADSLSAEAALKKLSALRDKFCAPSLERTSLRVATGVPFVEIVKCAREVSADLIVMGSHGRTGIEHLLIGSVAERVVRKAPCSVLVVRDAKRRFVMP
jgi:nucleotide-binding universal stress UspA family protein